MHGDHDYESDATDSRADDFTYEVSSDMREFDDCDGKQLQPFVPPPTRGLIEVEFTEGAAFGVKQSDLEKPEPAKEFPAEWKCGLLEILEQHKVVSWRPSFPLRYRWSRTCSDKVALDSYFKEGRHKFVTIQFSTDVDVLTVAAQLRVLPGVKQAVAVPDIIPPSQPQPRAEPYVGTGDQIMPIPGPEGCLSNQWYLFRCSVPGAWATPASGAGVVIADLDWGFDLSHQDLARTELTKNIIRDLPNVTDGNLLWHGNGVLGLAGATVNAQGMAGIAYGSTLWAIQAGTGAIGRPEADPKFWVEAIEFVRTTPATGRKIIILELQTAGFSNPEMIPSIRKEIMLAINDGIVVCVPAGNGNRYEDAGRSDCGWPIPATGSIVVGATRFDPDPTRNVRAGSNGGRRVTVYAPGDNEYDLTCGLRQGYRHHFGGTSSATAKVAGVVALMLEKNNRLTPHEVRKILAESQKPVIDEQNYEVGVLVDANQAVTDAIRMHSTVQATLSAPRMARGAGAGALTKVSAMALWLVRLISTGDGR